MDHRSAALRQPRVNDAPPPLSTAGVAPNTLFPQKVLFFLLSGQNLWISKKQHSTAFNIHKVACHIFNQSIFHSLDILLKQEFTLQGGE